MAFFRAATLACKSPRYFHWLAGYSTTSATAPARWRARRSTANSGGIPAVAQAASSEPGIGRTYRELAKPLPLCSVEKEPLGSKKENPHTTHFLPVGLPGGGPLPWTPSRAGAVDHCRCAPISIDFYSGPLPGQESIPHSFVAMGLGRRREKLLTGSTRMAFCHSLLSTQSPDCAGAKCPLF